MSINKRTYVKILFATLMLSLLVTSCGGGLGSSGQIQEQAEIVFQEFVTYSSVPYQNVRYDIINNDGTYANVNITAEFRVSANSDWTEHETTLQCRKIGDSWQCDSIFNMDFSSAEKQKQQATQQAAIASATQFWQNIQDTIKVEITGSPSLGNIQSDGIRDLMVNVKVTNNDTQPHVLCLFTKAYVNLPNNRVNPIEWWGLSWDNKENDCYLLINANSTENVLLGIGGGSGGHWAGDPSPAKIDSLSGVTYSQLCTIVQEIDGNSVNIEWKQDPSSKCK